MNVQFHKIHLLFLMIIFLLFTFATAQKMTTYSLPAGGWCTAIAIEGNVVWLGTQDEGVIKIDLNCSVLATYTTQNGLVDNWVTAIKIDEQGNKWFGTNYGISKFNGSTWTTYDTSNGLAQRNVRDIGIDMQNNKWFATSGGVSKFNGTTWTTYTTSDGLANNTVSALTIDGKGAKWFGTDNPSGSGISRFYGTAWTTFSTANGLADNGITTIVCDVQDNKWIGTFYGGVSKFNDTTWTTYNIATGMNNHVSSIAFDKNGNKWFGTALSGVLKFNGTAFQPFTMADGLLSDYVTSVAVDTLGNKWFGTRGGVTKLDESIVSVINANSSMRNQSSLTCLSNTYLSMITLRYHIPQNSQAKLSIYNVNGKGLRVLFDGIQKKGDHSIAWDGKQQDGQLLSAGCYLAKLETVGKTISCKVPFLR